MSLDHSSLHSHFSHVYVENDATEYPDTQKILASFPRAQIVPIRGYKEIFNRSAQHFQRQKRSMKLIVAVKQGQFIYRGSAMAPNFGQANFYYNAMILNCVYNCDYCYLQGMFPSANIVVFVNSEPFFQAADEILTQRGSIYLCISYDTDLLAFENIVPNCRRWIEWAERRPSALIEIRTKSANIAAIIDMPAPRNTILAWTISPRELVDRYERKTAPLAARLQAVREAIAAGWQVRICVDPILRVDGWQRYYSNMVEHLAREIPLSSMRDVSLGAFRMNAAYLRRIQRLRADSDILYYPFTITDNVCGYDDETTTVMVDHVRNAILRYAPGMVVYPRSS